MLKLTHSFCRYFNAAHSHFNKIYVNTFTHFVCQKDGVQSPILSGPHLNLKHQFQIITVKRNKFHYKKNNYSGDESKPKKRNKNMSGESWRPTLAHVSVSGQFEIAEDPVPLEQWRRRNDHSHSNTPSVIPPDFRVWEPTVTKCDGSNFRFRVVTYNVLAQYLLECHPYLYTDCSPDNLKWKIRAQRLYDEITNLDPDIICLQEVQESHLHSFYSKFEQRGFYGVYKQKTGDRRDGCAIYFKKSLFEMKDNLSVEFYQPSLPILNRDNIGIMVKLIPRGCPNTPFIVATTHLLYNPKRTDVRLAQIQVFLAEIDRFAFIRNDNACGYLPVVITGDLNSTPDSAVIKLLDRGRVSVGTLRDSSDWQRIGVTDQCQHLSVLLDRQAGKHTDNSNVKIYNSDYSSSPPSSPKDRDKDPCLYADKFNSGHVEHGFDLKSAYSKVKSDGNYEATTFQDYWVMVDYIYYSGNLRLVERLRLPTVNECLDFLGKLPNHVYGSDHLALAASFELRLNKASL